MNFVIRHLRPLVSAQTPLDIAYLLLGIVFGLLWFPVMIALYALGIGTIVVWVGVVVLVGAQALLRPIAFVERLQVRWLLRTRITPPRPLRPRPIPGAAHPTWAGLTRWSRELAHDGHSWQVLAWIFIRMVSGPVGFALAMVYLVVPLALLVAPVTLIGHWSGAQSQEWRHWLWAGPFAFLVIAPALAWAVSGYAELHRRLGRWALGPCGDEVRAATVRRATRAEEQIRIDQELHDSIGHMVSMIVVQAGAGAHVFDTDPTFARAALTNIEMRGRAALGELDRIIAHLRGDAPEAHAPLPGADDLGSLIAGARQAGVRVVDRIVLPTVPPAVGRGVYRVVQEALTNAAKHAPGSDVDVRIVGDAEVLAISVVNGASSVSQSPHSGGKGIASIQDRVILLGGHATVGPTTGGGFAVKAALPLAAMLPAEAKLTCTLALRCTCIVCTTIRKSAS